jgi:hypothetical protein
LELFGLVHSAEFSACGGVSVVCREATPTELVLEHGQMRGNLAFEVTLGAIGSHERDQPEYEPSQPRHGNT